ncbi:MAG: tetratricopeptide (TPR) repeat protein, partial [Myxococcota bacterium]
MPNKPLAALVLGFLLTAGCATATWQDASRDATDALTGGADDARVWAQAAELALVVDHDLSRAFDRATRARLASQPGSLEAARAAFVLVHLQAVDGQVAGVAEALAHALEGITNPARAEAIALATGAVWGLSEDAAKPDGRLVKALGAVAAKGGEAWLQARSVALAELISAARLAGTWEAYDAAFTRAGVVRSWALSAPWGYATTSAYAQTLGPETRALKSVEHTGHDLANRPVSTTFQAFSDGEALFFDLPKSEGVGFAQTTLTLAGPSPAPTGRRALVLLESNRRARVFVDGVAVVARGEQPNQDAWQQRSLVTFPDAAVRVTVKFASEEGGGFFRLRVVPEDPAVTVSTDARAASKSAVGTGASVIKRVGAPPSWLDQRTPLRTGESQKAVAALNQVALLLDRPKRDSAGARALAHTLRRALPDYPGLAAVEAGIARRDTLLTKTEVRQVVRERLEAVLAAWPTSRLALRGLAQVEADQDRPDTALRYWREALAVGPNDLQTQLGLLVHYRTRSWEAEALALATELAGARTSPRVLQEVVDTQLNFGRVRQAAATAKTLDAAFDGAGATRLAQIASDRGDHAVAAKQLALLVRRHPERHSVLRDAVQAYRAAGDLDAASRLVETFVALRPTDAWGLSEQVRIALQGKDQPGADRALDALLATQPDFAPMSVLQAWFAGKDQSLVEVLDGEAVVARWQALDAATRSEYAAFPVVSLLDNRVIDVRPDGSTIALRQQVRVVQSESAADSLGDFRPPSGAVLIRARTLKRDGRELLVERTEGKSDLSFRELKPGDAIETAWVVRSTVRPEEGGYLTGLVFANYATPTLDLRADVTVARPLTLLVRPSGPDVVPFEATTSEATGAKRWRWRGTGIAPVARERGAIGGRGFFPYVDLRIVPRDGGPTDLDAWRAISAYFGGLVERLTRSGPRLLALANALSATAKSPRLRAWSAFAWVKEELKNSEGFNNFETAADAAVTTGSGSRAIVLHALAQRLGLGSELLLCRPEVDGPAADRESPTPNANQFNYPIVAIDADAHGERYFFDVTRPYSPFDIVPPELYAARCLRPLVAVATATQTDLFVTLPNRAQWRERQQAGKKAAVGWTFEVDLTLDAAGTATGTLRGTGFGPESSALRQVYLNYDDARRETLWQHWAGLQFPGAKVIQAQVDEAGEASRPIRWTLNLEIPNYGRPEAGRMRIPAVAPPVIAEDLA